MTRTHVDSEATRMSARGWILGSRRRRASGSAPPGRRSASPASSARSAAAPARTSRSASLRSQPLTVVADDGVPLHVEVDDVHADRSPKRRRGDDVPDVTVVFVHGYCLNLDCWHFQRAAYRGLVRSVYYDQRSHGRSGRSDRAHATIDQLGRDLKQVIDHVAPDGPVVLVGHSMGGMSIVALAEQFPELIGDRVIGVGLISTTAGGLDPSRILLPMLPTRLTGRVTRRAVSHAAARPPRRRRRPPGRRRASRRSPPTGSRSATRCRRRTSSSSTTCSSATPFEVVADFFPSFGEPGQVRPPRGARPGPDLDHLRHLRQAHLHRPLAQAARSGSPARGCWSATAPATW